MGLLNLEVFAIFLLHIGIDRWWAISITNIARGVMLYSNRHSIESSMKLLNEYKQRQSVIRTAFHK